MTRVIVSSPVWSLNGINVFSAELTAGLRERGFDATILLTGVTYRERKPLRIRRDIPVEPLAIPVRATWRARRRALRAYLERNAPCVYLPNHDFNHSCITPSLPAQVGVIGIVHSDDQQHYDHFRRLGASWNAVVAVSAHIRERLEHFQIVDPPRFHTVPYGVRSTPRSSSPNDRPVRIIYTGRLEENQKRVSDLVRVAQKLVDMGVSFEMSIVGDGPERDSLATAITSAGLSRFVRMIGTVDPSRAAELCHEHDIFLLPSVYEGMPISLLEAMGQGCIPVVRNTRSGIPELITDGVNGMIVEHGNVDVFADRIRRIAADSALRRTMSEQAFATIANDPFTMASMIDAYSSLIDDVARESRAGTFARRSSTDPCPRMSLRDIIAAPLWSVRPSIRAQQTLAI